MFSRTETPTAARRSAPLEDVKRIVEPFTSVWRPSILAILCPTLAISFSPFSTRPGPFATEARKGGVSDPGGHLRGRGPPPSGRRFGGRGYLQFVSSRTRRKPRDTHRALLLKGFSGTTTSKKKIGSAEVCGGNIPKIVMLMFT